MMNTILIAIIISACLISVVLLGMRLRLLLPENQMTPDTKDTVKLAMGLVATMTALLLGLLVSSAKSAYDTTRDEVIAMAAKVSYLDGLLTAYGAEASNARALLRAGIETAVRGMWPERRAEGVRLAPDAQTGHALYTAIQELTPQDELQRGLKAQAAGLAVELRQLRYLLLVQSVSSISRPLLWVVVSWLLMIFLSFSVLAPSNATARAALIAAALSVSGAIFLILEFDRPFSGVMQIPSDPIKNAVGQVLK
jgi:hypothetical protein